MTAFGKQLVPFGEAMKQFGDAITGLDANAVTEAAIAGKAMAEMATTIPNSGWCCRILCWRKTIWASLENSLCHSVKQ